MSVIKHQCIASKLSDINAFGADPRRVAKAGHDVDNAEPIDFGKKYGDQNNAFTARFDSLGSKFKGKTLDDYVNGKSFCCGDKNLDEIEKNNTQTAENAKIEDNLYFYHPDHLGSTNLITNFDGEVTQSVAYIPYGEVFVEERNGSWATPFLFNAKELDEETGLYYYGARYLDPMDCRWLAVDPVFHPGASPYSYCSGNPIRHVDPDGREDIVVCGSQYDESAGNKLMFVNQGIRAMREMAESNPNESRTMILFKEGYTENQIKEIGKSISKFGGNLKLVDSASEMIDYINNKNGDRASDKINNMEIYAHGLNGSIEFGYHISSVSDKYALDKKNVSKISPNAFNGLQSNIASYACRTALGSDASSFGFDPMLSNSLAQSLATASGAKVSAYARRTNYSGTLGSTLDRHPWLSAIMPLGVLPYPIPQMKTVDGAAFTPNGSNRRVVAGDTPIGISSSMFHFNP